MNETTLYPDERPLQQRQQAKSAPPAPDSAIQGLKELRLEEKDRLEDLPQMRPNRPETPRRTTDTSSSPLLAPHQSPSMRNRSPYARPHLRSTSLTAPVMTRAHSSPTPMSPTSHLSLQPAPRPSSPLRSPARVRASLKFDESYPPSTASSVSDIGIISEEQELDIAPRRSLDSSTALNMHAGNAFGRQRRRPMSPLHSSSGSFGAATSPSTPSQPSPTLSAAKFNEPFPATYPSSYSSSSMPSTPTSVRSRSPSISSLETIEDSPDAEEEATEADRIAKMEAAAKAAENGGEGLRRSSLDVPRARPMGFGMGSRDKRKRWSVCGAEKRSDLDLETIWED